MTSLDNTTTALWHQLVADGVEARAERHLQRVHNVIHIARITCRALFLVVLVASAILAAYYPYAHAVHVRAGEGAALSSLRRLAWDARAYYDTYGHFPDDPVTLGLPREDEHFTYAIEVRAGGDDFVARAVGKPRTRIAGRTWVTRPDGVVEHHCVDSYRPMWAFCSR